MQNLHKDLSAQNKYNAEIRVCSTGCRALGALDVCDALETEVTRRRLTDMVRIVRTGCHGLCAGAVAVVGHHPHVPQGWERYRDGLIFYSLGDYLMDFPGRRVTPANAIGLQVHLAFENGTLLGARVDLVSPAGQGPRARMSGSPPGLDLLREVSEILTDNTLLSAVWQECAIRMWHDFYANYLMTPGRLQGTGVPSGLGERARDGLKRMFGRSADAHPSADMKQWVQLLLLHLFRCDSHRWALETALGVLSGSEVDLRSRTSAEIVSRHLARYEGCEQVN